MTIKAVALLYLLQARCVEVAQKVAAACLLLFHQQIRPLKLQYERCTSDNRVRRGCIDQHQEVLQCYLLSQEPIDNPQKGVAGYGE